MKVNRKWAAMGLFAAVQLMGKCRKNAFEMAQIYGTTVYLKGVRVLRHFVLFQIGILACVFLLVSGVLLMEAAAVFYIPMGTSGRVGLALALGGINFLTGGIFLAYFISSKRWLFHASKYNGWLEAAIRDERFSSPKNR